MKNEMIITDKFVYRGLLFEVSNLTDLTGVKRDTAVILLWTPNCADTPVQIVGVCSSDPAAAEIGWWLNNWFSQLHDEDINELIVCQDMSTDGYPVVDEWPAE